MSPPPLSLAEANVRALRFVSALSAAVMPPAILLEFALSPSGGLTPSLTFAIIEGVIFLLLCAVIWPLTRQPRGDRLVTWIFGLGWSAVAAVAAWAGVAEGTFTSPLFYAVLTAPFVASVPVVPLRTRIGIASAVTLTWYATTISLTPDFLGDPRAGALIGLQLAVTAAGVGIGHAIYLLLAADARRRERLIATQRELAALNDELEARVADQTETLRALTRRLTELRDIESARIARDLHDELGQTLTAMRHQLYRARRHAGDVRLREPLLAAEAQLDTVHKVVRDLVDELRPPDVVTRDLRDAVELLIQRTQRLTEADIVLEDGEVSALPEEVAVAAYRIIQEALTNAVRHANGASRITLSLRSTDSALQCRIRDDGPGLPAAAIGRGVGLTGMTERARQVGGTLTFKDPGVGLEIVFTAPLRPPSPAPHHDHHHHHHHHHHQDPHEGHRS